MTFEQLVAIEAIVSTGTFRGAAGRLHKAQSAISHQVRKLEDELQFELFSRSEYRPRLTAKGEVFYREAVRILHHVRGLRATAAGLRAEQEAVVNISVTATMPLAILLAALEPISNAYPATHIRLTADMMGGPVARLMRDEADLIIASLADVPVDDVDTAPVGSVTIKPVCHPEFLPASYDGVRSVSEMQAHLQVVVADTVGGEFEQSRDLMPGGRRWTVSDFETKKAVLLSCIGWGGMPEHMVESELADGRLVVLNVEGFPPRRSELYAMRKRGKEIGQVQADLWKALSDL